MPTQKPDYGYLRMENPPFESQIASRVADAINCGYRSFEIPCAPVGRPGNCYWNVEHAVQLIGGNAVQGWLIQWWPGKLVVALHHAAWFHPELRHLVDPTAKDARDPTANRSSFLQDDSIRASLDFPSKIRPKFFKLVEDPNLDMLIQAWGDTIDLERELVRRMYARGARYGYLMELAGNPDLQPPDLTQFQRDEDLELLLKLQIAGEIQRRAIRALNGDPSAHL